MVKNGLKLTNVQYHLYISVYIDTVEIIYSIYICVEDFKYYPYIYIINVKSQKKNSQKNSTMSF